MCLFLPCLVLSALSAFAWGWLAHSPTSHQPRRPTAGATAPKPPHTPKPATPRICPQCEKQHALTPRELLALLSRPVPPAWSTRKGKGGPPKTHDSTGLYCPHPGCEYFAIADPNVHALVADGRPRGSQNWQCQACGQHVCQTFGTFRYYKKKPLETIGAVLKDLCQGHPMRQTAQDHQVDKNTVLAWLAQLGERAPVIWSLLAEGKLQLSAVQLEELKTLVGKTDGRLSEQEQALGVLGSQWLWTAMDPVSKLLLIAQVGPRTQVMACGVIHALCALLVPGCVPAFASDGLMHYFYALTAHFGAWCTDEKGKARWHVSSILQYGQVIKHYRRQKLSHIVRHMLLGTLEQLRQTLAAAGTRPSLNTSFVERLNLTLRCQLAALRRRSPYIAKCKRCLQYRLNVFLVYYNLIRLHSSLETTPAHAAGLTDHAWRWEELLQLRLPPERQYRLAG